MRSIKIFLSSPGDCSPERMATHEIVMCLNADPVISSFVNIEIVAWDWSHGVPLDALCSPQTSVNSYLATPENCDVFIGISRCRFGTPLPMSEFRKENGEAFLSGSEYEFDRAWKSRRLGAISPTILIYQSNDLVNGKCLDDEQTSLTKAFFEAAPFKDQEGWTGSVVKFNNTEDYKQIVDHHLRKIISQWQPSARQPLETWLATNARKLLNDAGPRYTGAAHVDSNLSKFFDWLLVRPEAIKSIDILLAEVWDKIKGVSEFSKLQASLAETGEHFRSDPYWRVMPDLNCLKETLQNISILAWKMVGLFESKAEQINDQDKYKCHQFSTAANKAQEAVNILEKYSTLATNRILLLTGPAGQGKTHTLVHEVIKTLDGGGIAIGILGQTLSSSDDLTSALQRRWNHDDSLQSFLDSLENAAEQLNQRALLVIDALNETPNRKRWKHELRGILGEIIARPNLTVAISIRTDYLSFVLPKNIPGESSPWVTIEHTGFSGVEPEALLSYYKHYGVQAPIAPPLGELGNPLYVQLLLKSLQGRAPAEHWLPSWLEVWSSWIDRLEEDVIEIIDIEPSRQQPIRRILKQLAKAMLDQNQFHLSRESAENIATKITGKQNIIGFLCSAGALIDRIDQDVDIIEYAFERLSDTFFMDCLLDHLFNGVKSREQRKALLVDALSPDGALSHLATPNFTDSFLSQHRLGLLEALCLAAPIQIGNEIPELIPVETKNQYGINQLDWELREAFTDSFRWRSNPSEFALESDALWEMWNDRGYQAEPAEHLDELIRLSLIPNHPFSFENKLHPWLLEMESPGERDAAWSILLVELLGHENSCLQTTLTWATRANLEELQETIALPISRLLAWTCAVSQNAMRKDAIKGLTRILISCPSCLSKLLPDFLSTNDAYILEAVLIATWGVVIDGQQPDPTAHAAKLVYDSMFSGENVNWCHLTIRHYSRCIVEDAVEKNWLSGIDLVSIRPPYFSKLPLNQVPEEKILRKYGTSSAFSRIIGSTLDHDFYWYVMGATSGSKPFSSNPLTHSTEPFRSFSNKRAGIPSIELSTIFDIPLAARFVAWNCLELGWTKERFNEFDTGFYTSNHERISSPGRTERVGKKYQWIGWQTMLAFLSDNYEMTPESNGIKRLYDSPNQISYIDVFDPSRWLQDDTRQTDNSNDESFWEIPSMPYWPQPDNNIIKDWISNSTYDLPPMDVISTIPDLPETWGKGPWVRVVAEHIWANNFAPGCWVSDQEYLADIWLKIMPALVKKSEFPVLLQKLKNKKYVEHTSMSIPRDYDSDSETPLNEWPFLAGDFDEGFILEEWNSFPVPWMPLAGISGNPDEDNEVLIPWPRLFREWELTLDLRKGVVRYKDQIVFGLASWSLGERALFANLDILQKLLKKSEYTLIWFIRGERQAWLDNQSKPNSKNIIETSSVAYLGPDSRVNTIYISRNQLNYS